MKVRLISHSVGMFNIIAACDDKWGIGKDGGIPWTDTDIGREDMSEFRRQTIGGVVIMGRKTFESIGAPLRERWNIVVSRDEGYRAKLLTGSAITGSLLTAASLDDALVLAVSCMSNPIQVKSPYDAKIWVIGGADLYTEALKHPRLHRAYISRIPDDFECNVFMPSIGIPQVGGYSFGFDNCVDVEIYGNGDEDHYLTLMKRLMTAPLRPNRTGIPTRGLFAEKLEFSLTRGADRILPLLTTKKVPARMVIAELLWFMSGKCTDVHQLRANKCYIWDDNTTREFLDSRGLTNYTEGECGPIYGYQWRSWNRPYTPMKDTRQRKSSIEASDVNDNIYTVINYSVAAVQPEKYGIDQLARVIKTLRTDPFDRRMIVSAWNPEQLDQMALPPCHWSFQFHCEMNEDKHHPQKYTLNCLLNMRSADFALGVPFNIASYALLTHMVALCVDMKPGRLVIVMADCHLYTNHLQGAGEQASREPGQFPTVRFNGAVAGGSIDQFTSIDQVVIEGYQSHGPIKYPMAV